MYKFEVSSLKMLCRGHSKNAKTKNLERAITQVISKDKNLKKLLNLHMAIENFNPKLWIHYYNSSAKISDLRFLKTFFFKKS